MSQVLSRPPSYSKAFFAAQAHRERHEGDLATLGNVRAKHHRAADAWQVLANRAEGGPTPLADRTAYVAALIDLPSENPDRFDR